MDYTVIQNGVIDIATTLQGNMSSGTTKIGALFFNSCDTLGNGVVPIVGLTDDYNTFVSAINSSTPQGGNGMVAYSMVKAYDLFNRCGFKSKRGEKHHYYN